MVSIDDSADRGRISEPVPETDSNEAFEVRRRKPPALAVGSLALGDEVAGDVVAIAPSLLDGMAGVRGPRPARQRQAPSAARLPGPFSALAVRVGGQGGLNLIPQRFIDNGLMLAGIGLVLVDHLAPVEAIVEQVIQAPRG